MRGRKPRPLTLSKADAPLLEFIARDHRLAWFQVQHARIVLAVAAGRRIGDIARRPECDRTTIWRVCRRYREGGLRNILAADREAHNSDRRLHCPTCGGGMPCQLADLIHFAGAGWPRCCGEVMCLMIPPR